MAETSNLKGKSLLTLDSLSEKDIYFLLDLAAKLKRKKKAGIRGNLLRQKIVGLIFEKPSTRTRCAATVAAVDEGGCIEYMDAKDLHLGKKESVADTARVLGRMLDGILFRGYKQEMAETLAKYAGIPVWNGLTDESHPTQILADLMTVRENFGKLRGLKVVYVGDGRNNVANSLMSGCSRVGMNFVNCTPAELEPGQVSVERAAAMALTKGGSVRIEHSPELAVKDANVVYTDVWVSMGEETRLEERIRLLRPYQVNMDLMRRTGNLENGKAIFLHCLPAFHDNNTDLTKNRGPLEVSDDVFEAAFSKVFDQAEDKVHTLKALMVATIGRAPGVSGRGAGPAVKTGK